MSEINEYRQDTGNEEMANAAELQIFDNNKESWADVEEIPEDEIKFYPGSIKGRAPEDDPKSYSKWFVDH